MVLFLWFSSISLQNRTFSIYSQHTTFVRCRCWLRHNCLIIIYIRFICSWKCVALLFFFHHHLAFWILFLHREEFDKLHLNFSFGYNIKKSLSVYTMQFWCCALVLFRFIVDFLMKINEFKFRLCESLIFGKLSHNNNMWLRFMWHIIMRM